MTVFTACDTLHACVVFLRPFCLSISNTRVCIALLYVKIAKQIEMMLRPEAIYSRLVLHCIITAFGFCRNKSRHTSPLWLLLRSKGIPEKILILLEDLYSNTLSCVRVDGELSPWFKISSGVRQACILAPGLFLEPMEWLLDRAVHRGYLGLTVGNEIFSDLDFADDVSLLASMMYIF